MNTHRHKCPECDYNHEKLISLSIHYRRRHKKTSKQLYIELNCNGILPKCKCGCEEESNFLSIETGFREYKRGHSARIHNNWGHNPTALANSITKRQAMFGNACGAASGWNKGLTKETSPSIAAAVEKYKEWKNQPEVKQFYSKTMSKNRLSGLVPTQYGSSHSQWKGGTSEISVRCYANNKLYDEWKYPILLRDGFKCTHCSNTKNLHVHHDKKSLASIVKKFINEGNISKKLLSFDENTVIMEKVVDYHINTPVSGLTLCEDCHKKEHNHLNF